MEFRKREDVKLYGQMPDYGDFQGHDLWQGGILHQAALRFYSNFHMPSSQAMKHHLFSVKSEITKIKELAGSDKRMNLNKNGRAEE